MDALCEVIYQRPQRARFYLCKSGNLKQGDQVVMVGKHEVGRVIWKGVSGDSLADAPLTEVQRASVQDCDQALDLRQKERTAFEVFKTKIEAHGLPMKPIEVRFEADGTRVTFYFSADQRVDFRQLVRDLAREYHRRIELRQISPRVESQMLGGCGTCGRELCCASFVRSPQHVPVKVAQGGARAQNLSKLVGVCGQLKCCLRFEQNSSIGCAGCHQTADEDVIGIENGTSRAGGA